jgi:hypothetical protein
LNPENGSSVAFSEQLADCLGINGTSSSTSSGATASSTATGTAKVGGSSATTTGSGSGATTTGSGSTAAATTTSSSTTKSEAGRVALSFAGVAGVLVIAAAFLA